MSLALFAYRCGASSSFNENAFFDDKHNNYHKTLSLKQDAIH